MLCQECKGFGQYIAEYIGGHPRHEECGWCWGTGEVSATVRGVWLRFKAEEKERKAERLGMQRKEALSFELPMPPSVNQMYANAPGKGRVKTDKYKTWRDTAGWELKLAKAEPLPPECKRWGISIRVPLSGADIDNVVKAISDLLVWMKLTPDDRYMRSLHVYRDHEVAKGRCQVTVWPIN